MSRSILYLLGFSLFVVLLYTWRSNLISWNAPQTTQVAPESFSPYDYAFTITPPNYDHPYGSQRSAMLDDIDQESLHR